MKNNLLVTCLWIFALAISPSLHLRADETSNTRTHILEKVTTTVHETTTIVEETIEETPADRTVAIFIKNRAGKAFEDKLGAYEDMVVGAITDMGFQAISPEDTAMALQAFAGSEDGKKIKPTDLDQHLLDKSSAIRLAQSLQADYLFIASVTTFGQKNQHLKRADLGIDRRVTDYTLRTSYKILDGNNGKSLSAGNITSKERAQQSADLQSIDTDVLNTLLAKSCEALAAKLEIKGATAAVADVKLNDKLASFVITPSIQNLNVPEIVVDDHGKYQIGEKTFPLQAINVDVELDGVVIGTAPGKLEALPGLHTIKVHHPNFKPWERTINIRKDMTLNIPMVMSESATKKFKEMTLFLSKLKQSQQLTDAQAEKIRSFAQMLRQSGFRIDNRSDSHINIEKKSDIKVNTDKAPTVVQNNIERQNSASAVWPE